MENLCDICECKRATLKCTQCNKNNLLCDECFSLKHGIPSMTGHKALTFQQSHENAKTLNPDTHNGCYQCAVHHLERRYICLECKITICSDCIVIGEHKHHNATLFSEVEKYVKADLGEVLSGSKEILDGIAKIKTTAISKKDKLSSSMVKAREKIKQTFSLIHEKMINKEAEILKTFDKNCSDKFVPYSKCEASLMDIESQSKEAYVKLEKFINSTKTPDEYDNLKNFKAPNISMIKETMSKIEKDIAEACNSIPHPTIGFDIFDLGLDLLISFGSAEEAAEKTKRIKKFLENEKAQEIIAFEKKIDQDLSKLKDKKIGFDKMKSSFVYSYPYNSENKILILYDPIKQIGKSYQVAIDDSSWINTTVYGDKIYICGSILNFEITVASDLSAIIRKLTDRKLSRTNHSCCVVGGKYLYVLGGSNKNTERMILEKGLWENEPDMNFSTRGAILLAFEDRFLYSFGDYDSAKVIERIDVELENRKWEIIMENTGINFGWGAAFALNQTDILILGEYPKMNSYIFNLESHTFSEKQSVGISWCFQTQALMFENDVYVTNGDDGKLFAYSKMGKKWREIDVSAWKITKN